MNLMLSVLSLCLVLALCSGDCPCPGPSPQCSCDKGGISCFGRSFPIFTNSTGCATGFKEILIETSDYAKVGIMPKATFREFQYKEDIESLTVLGVGISGFEPGVFAAIDTYELKIASSSLKALNPLTFSGIKRANVIDLSFSSIQRLDSGVFQPANGGLEKLSASYMTSEPLTIGKGAFGNASSVRTLSLTNNHGLVIEQGALASLSQLQQLDLGNSRGAVIPVGSFANLVNLKSLNLANCLLHSITAKTFMGLKSLTSLFITDNVFDQVEAGAFAPLQNLDSISLTLGPGGKMNLDAFYGVSPQLRHVYLSVNMPSISIYNGTQPVHTKADLILDFGDEDWCIDITPAICQAFTKVTMFKADLVCEKIKHLCN